MKTLKWQGWMAIGLGLLSAAAANWPITTGEIEMTGFNYVLRCSIGGFVGGIATALFLRLNVRQASWYVLLGFALAILIRVIVEIIPEPSNHNLWPFEVALTVIIALPACVTGSFLGAKIQRHLTSTKREQD